MIFLGKLYLSLQSMEARCNAGQVENALHTKISLNGDAAFLNYENTLGTHKILSDCVSAN